MRRTVRILKTVLPSLLFILLFLTVLFPAFSSVLFASGKPLVRVGVTHFPPWITEKDGIVKGYDYEMMQALFQELGVEAEYVPLVFSDILGGLRSGEVDIAANLLFRNDRNDFIRYISPPYRTKSIIRFYTRNDSGITVKKYIDIAGLKVAVSTGYRYFPTFDLDDRMIKVEYPSHKEAFKALAEGEVDLAICPDTAGDYYLQELGVQESVRTCLFSYAPRFMPVYIGVSRNSPLNGRADDIGEIILRLQESGKLDEIAGRHSVTVH